MTESSWWTSDKLASVYERILSLPYGDRIFQCIQCGTCGGACPVSFAMDKTPRQVINLVRSGRVEEALRSESIWLCASCYGCTVQCPAGIKITEIMYALKESALEFGFESQRAMGPTFAKAFVGQVESRGRIAETELIIRVALHDPKLLFTLNPLVYVRLFLASRVKLLGKKTKNINELQKMNRWVDANAESARGGEA